MNLETWARSDIGLVRKSNQDALGRFPELSLFVVADGMGGRSDGEVASGLAIDAVRETIAHGSFAASDPPPPEERPLLWRMMHPTRSSAPPPAAVPDLQGAVALANQRVYEAGQNRPESPRGSMGTTVVMLFCALADRRAYWAHVGDSRLYRVRGGEAALLTADHTVFGEPYWDQSPVPFDLPHTNRLIRAIGIEPAVEVTLGSDDLCPGDLYLLCSDGVSGMVAPSQLRALLRGSGTIDEIGKSLISAALAGGGRDNATALLVQVAID